MPIKTQSFAKPGIVAKFKATPVMSTYLVTLVIGELQEKEFHNIRVIARPQINVNFNNTLDLANRLSRFIKEYTQNVANTALMLPKIDHVIIPGFSPKHEQNWGIALYW